MSDLPFSSEHKGRFQEICSVGELFALNDSAELLEFGPWIVECELSDSDLATRLKARFRSAARSAALAAGAPARANLLDWWISKVAGRTGRLYIRDLVQRSSEYCEELESNSLELKPLVDEMSGAPGLRRDRYQCDGPVPYCLYTEPHRLLLDPKAEFAYWDKRIWDSFYAAVEKIARSSRKRRRWVDEKGNQHVESKEDTRRRVEQRVTQRTGLLDAFILGLSYDAAVLQANYTIDRGFRAEGAMEVFEAESAELVEKVRLAWHTCSKRLGLSCKKQENRGLDLAKPFREVGADLRQLVLSTRLFSSVQEVRSGIAMSDLGHDQGAAPASNHGAMAVPEADTSGRAGPQFRAANSGQPRAFTRRTCE